MHEGLGGGIIQPKAKFTSMPLANKVIAGAAGSLALMAVVIGSEPKAADPVTLPVAAPLAEQATAPAKAPILDTAPAPAAVATTATSVQMAVEPKAFTVPAAEQPKPRPASPKPAPVPVSSTGGDRDCSDFGSHAEAQRFFIESGGPYADPHRLDRDHDGIAWESN
jgi:hypothetical protein